MKFVASFGIVAFTILLLSCGSTVKVSTDYDRSVDFSKYKSFGFYKLANSDGSISELNKNRIVSAIKSELIKKGLNENDSNPDVLVNATAVMQDKKSVSSTTNYYGSGGLYRPYGWGTGFSGSTTYNVYDYKAGSLIIDVIDASSKQLIWQGTGNKEIDKPSKNPDQTINEAVSKILAGFPPAPAK